MFSKTLIAAFSLLAVANAHLAIQQPVPIPGTETKSPLDASGSDFPCHGADLTQGTKTPMAHGTKQSLAFNLGGGANTAVHGGGSCQLSLTYETDKTKQKDPANWKVITSFIGGCPTDAKGNLPTSVACPGGAPDCVNSFQFDIPKEAQNGDAILAWTWFNNIGNREMYMNCARVSISGATDGSSGLASLPSLFVANLASINQCHTTEQFNTDFPNPGQYVIKDSTMNYPLKAPTGSGCGSGSGSAAVAASPASGSSGSSGASSPAAAASPATASSNNGQYTGVGAAGAKQTQTAAGAFAPGAAPASTLATQVVPAAASTPTSAPAAAAPAAAAPAAAAPASSSSGSGTCAAGSVACTASGFYCIDAMHFGQCAFGCAIPMQMAAGTNCANGAVTFAASKRSVSLRQAMKHIRRQIL